MNDVLLTAGDRLRLRFFRRSGRWQHTVECREADRLIWQLESAGADAVEFAADENWPSSPPFQSIELHSEPSGHSFALLVGMAGASHWSASVEADADRERFVFDMACRVKTSPGWLGSSYLVSDGTMPLVKVINDPAGGEPAAIESIERRIFVRAADLPGELPRTVRWKYAILAAPRR